MGAQLSGVARRRAPGPPAPAAALRDRGRPGNPRRLAAGDRRPVPAAATSRSSSPTRRAAGTARRSSLRRGRRPGGGLHLREAALSGDQAAEVDRLGVAPLADGLARLIMLPQTRPLTVGVQAPWGWGSPRSSPSCARRSSGTRPATALCDSELGELEDLDRVLGGAIDTEEQESDAEIAATRLAQAERRRNSSQELERRALHGRHLRAPSTHGATKAPSRCGPASRARSPRGSRER